MSEQKKKATQKKEPLEAILIKVSKKDKAILKANAQKHAQGNLSAWLRHTGLNHDPVDGEIIFLDAHS